MLKEQRKREITKAMTSSHDEIPGPDQLLQPSSRRKRKDAGQPRYEDRDYYALKWIGQQGAIRYDQLRRLLGRESPERHDWNAVLSPSATNNAIDRWEVKRLVNAAHIMPKEPKYSWLSAAGFQFVSLDLPHYSPKRRDMAHLLACNQVRLSIELLNRTDEHEFGNFERCTWISQREIQRLDPERKMHTPTAQFNTPMRGRLAIEVITEQEDVEPIMRVYAQSSAFNEVWYFALGEQLVRLDQIREQIRKSGIDVSKIFTFNSDTSLVPVALPKRIRAKKGS
jgi:hypothetical protein